VRSRPETFFDECLHLSVSMRSFRAENVSAFVKALLDRDVATARRTYEHLPKATRQVFAFRIEEVKGSGLRFSI
jgi:hypothetical protein